MVCKTHMLKVVGALGATLSLLMIASSRGGSSLNIDLGALGEKLTSQVSQVQIEETLVEPPDNSHASDTSLVPESLKRVLALEAEGLDETGTLAVVDAKTSLQGEPEVLSTHPNGVPKEVQYNFLMETTTIALVHFRQDTVDDPIVSKAMIPIVVRFSQDGEIISTDYEDLATKLDPNVGSLDDLFNAPPDS